MGHFLSQIHLAGQALSPTQCRSVPYTFPLSILSMCSAHILHRSRSSHERNDVTADSSSFGGQRYYLPRPSRPYISSVPSGRVSSSSIVQYPTLNSLSLRVEWKCETREWNDIQNVN